MAPLLGEPACARWPEESHPIMQRHIPPVFILRLLPVWRDSSCHSAHEANCNPFVGLPKAGGASPVGRRAGYARAGNAASSSETASRSPAEAAMATIGAVTWLF
jgi:hypothetical protein